jgi:uncharacterized membrane protein YdjX (TVP38/TMEM64 family)
MRHALKPALAVAALAGLAILVWRVWDHDAVLAWMRGASAVRFFTAMTLLTLVGVPVTPLLVIAGATFGVVVGLAGSVLSLAGSLTASYAIARGRLRRWLEALLHRLGSELPDFGEAGRNALRFTVMVKLTPGLPAPVKNYVLAAAGVPFPIFFGVSLLITVTYAAALVLVGDSLFQHELAPGAAAVAILMLVAALLVLWLRRRRGGAARGSEGPGPGGRPHAV